MQLSHKLHMHPILRTLALDRTVLTVLGKRKAERREHNEGPFSDLQEIGIYFHRTMNAHREICFRYILFHWLSVGLGKL